MMGKKTVSFRMDSDWVDELDRLAGPQKRDRTFLLNEAVEEYLTVQKSHLELIKEGLRDAEAGRVTSHDEVVTLTKTWRSTALGG